MGEKRPAVSQVVAQKIIGDNRRHSPTNPKEIYNLRHSSARNVIERIFGVLKERFKIMEHGCDYGILDQAGVVMAICLLFNMVRTFEREDFPIGTTIAPRADIRAGRVYEQEDLSVLDTDLQGFAEGEAGARRGGISEASNPPLVSRAAERRELEAAQLGRAQAM